VLVQHKPVFPVLFLLIAMSYTIDCQLFWVWKMSCLMPSLDDFYVLFHSHLLSNVLGLPGDSFPVKSLMDSVGIKLQNDTIEPS